MTTNTAQLTEMKKMDVISLDEGRDLGTVRRVFLDPEAKRVTGFLLRGRGLGADWTWLPSKEVDRIGEDVVFVRGGTEEGREPTGRSLHDLVGTRVATRDGQVLGSLVDLGMDDSWAVTDLELSGNRALSVEDLDAVRIGEDLITVPAGVDEQDLNDSGDGTKKLLSRIFGEETMRETAEAISRAARAVAPDEDAERSNR